MLKQKILITKKGILKGYISTFDLKEYFKNTKNKNRDNKCKDASNIYDGCGIMAINRQL